MLWLLFFLVLIGWLGIGVVAAWLNYVLSLRSKPDWFESIFIVAAWPYLLYKFLV